jgi:flagellar biosynthesis/type III secretory pathway M-ring protein FliF/YscJ
VGHIGGWDEGLWALLPTLAVGLLFWFVMRAILRADRTERAAQAKYEAEREAERAAPEPVEASDGDRHP